MLNKLLKYDLKWIYKVVVVFYILALVFSVFTRLFTSIDNSILFNIVGHICSGFAIGMMISSLINAMMRLWVRFIRNIYKDESYLTHTLPVSKKTIYLSKVLTGIICIFTTVIVSIVCLFICFYSKGNMQILKSFLELAASTYDTTVIHLLLIISLVLFLEILFILLIGYTGIIIGHKRNKNKMMHTLIVSFIMYIATQGITLLIIYIFGLFNSDVMNVINTTDIVNINAIKTIMYLGIIIYVIYNIIYYYIGKHLLEKGVNVD
jgi:hypothetical protein